MTSRHNMLIRLIRSAGLPLGAIVCLLACVGFMESAPVFSGDGRYLAFGVLTPPPMADAANATREGRVALYDASREQVLHLPLPERTEAFLPRWSPDGTQLAYLMRDTRWGVGLYDVEHMAPRQLYRAAQGAVLGAHLAYSPDGATVVINQRRSGEPFQIVRIDTTSGQATRHATGLYGWPVDATGMVWLDTNANDESLRLDPAARLMLNDRPIHPDLPGTPCYPALSADGGQIAYWLVQEDKNQGHFEPGQSRVALVSGPLESPVPTHWIRRGTLPARHWWQPIWDRQGKSLTFVEPMEHNTNNLRVLQYVTTARTAQELKEGGAAVSFHPSTADWAFTTCGTHTAPRTGLYTSSGPIGLIWLE